MTKTQKPNATKKDFEHYLSFLIDDVRNQHFPNAPSDSRGPNGKKSMRKDMPRYLGFDTDYEAKNLEYIIDYNSIALKHTFSAEGLRADGLEFSYNKVLLNVIELENGKVSVIRRYGKHFT